jgi:hypothetical protein
MPMPANFKYKDVFLKGKPHHDMWDIFRIKHPKMDCGKRAKIFTPFDALKGFSEEVASKRVLYEDKILIDQAERDELDRRLNILHGLTFNSRMAKQNQVHVTVTYYEPCQDTHNEAYGLQGRYLKVTGICWNVDTDITNTIRIDDRRISVRDIIRIESPAGIFEREWESICFP